MLATPQDHGPLGGRRLSGTRKASLLAPLLIGLVAIAAGCGDARGDARPSEEKWMAAVCTAISSSQQEMLETLIRPIQRVRPASGPRTRATMFRTIADTRLLLRTLETEIARLDPPTKSSRFAQQAMLRLVRTHVSFFDKLRGFFGKEFRKLPAEPTARQNGRILEIFELTLRNARWQLAADLSVMLDVEPSLVGSFRDADECKDVQSNR